jgi:4-diphosphocytidyl-2-C-methyl-D-erythritol kinase
MILFPNAKINIGLQVLQKRKDGYHDISTVFYPVKIYDVIEVIETVDQHFESSGINFNNANDNSCIKAWSILKNDFPALPNISLHLYKHIPIGAGLGGGSADAAFSIMLLNTKFDLGLTATQLAGYALQLGSDCPFFIYNQSCHATGRGEILDPVSLDLSNYDILIIYPGIHINTRIAFSLLKTTPANTFTKDNIMLPVNDWRDNIMNDFEQPIFQMHPEINELKQHLYSSGAIYASMSGSGSSVYGIFNKGSRPVFKFPENYFFAWV